MIGVLGIKRVAMLIGLVVLNGLLAAMLFGYLQPESLVKDRELSGLRGQVSTLRTDIDRMQVEFEQLEVQKAEFEQLEADGFFKDQSRRQAEKVLEKIQQSSGVSTAIANIQAGVIEDNPEAQKASYKILKSPMELRIEAYDDVNIYHYLFLIEHYFPGHVTVEEINIERNADVTGTVLRAISSGVNPALIQADVDLVWRTMIPESRVIGQEGAQQP